ncbi:MAG: winged helix-turn-helix domain-containing protein, partial [Myxococcota bacterium]
MGLRLTGCEVDLETGEVTLGGRRSELTRREIELLVYLAARPDQDVSRAALQVDVWGYSPNAQTRAIDNMVRKLRSKVELDPDRPRHVCTVPGGYRFVPARALAPDTRYGDRFVGREELLAATDAALRDGHLVLTGMPGVGKTRLGWEGVRRWGGRACGCALHGAG